GSQSIARPESAGTGDGRDGEGSGGPLLRLTPASAHGSALTGRRGCVLRHHGQGGPRPQPAAALRLPATLSESHHARAGTTPRTARARPPRRPILLPLHQAPEPRS